MNRTLLIFRHEFLKSKKGTGFIVLTLSLPILALLGIGIYSIASGMAKPPAEVTRVGYVDQVGGFNQSTTQRNITLVRFDTTESATQALAIILGYSVFAVLSAGIAAATSTVQDAQGLAGLYTPCAVGPFWFVGLLLFYPNSPAWVVFSIFPLSAPVLAMMRLGLIGVPAWQLGVSIGVLILCVIAGLMLDGKLLRAYMLMYGKRPNLGEIICSLGKA